MLRGGRLAEHWRHSAPSLPRTARGRSVDVATGIGDQFRGRRGSETSSDPQTEPSSRGDADGGGLFGDRRRDALGRLTVGRLAERLLHRGRDLGGRRRSLEPDVDALEQLRIGSDDVAPRPLSRSAPLRLLRRFAFHSSSAATGSRRRRTSVCLLAVRRGASCSARRASRSRSHSSARRNASREPAKPATNPGRSSRLRTRR